MPRDPERSFQVCTNSLLCQTANRNAGAALRGTLEAWKTDLTDLKCHDRACTSMKDTIKDCLERQEHHSKVLKFFKKDGDLDPTQKHIKSITGMDQDAYQRAGHWFLESDSLKNWMTSDERSIKKVIVLKGTSKQTSRFVSSRLNNCSGYWENNDDVFIP